MRLCFIADGRSPIAQNWIRHFLSPRSRFEVHLISSHVCDGVDLPGATIHTVQTLMSSTWLGRRRAPDATPGSPTPGVGRLAACGLRAALSEARWWVGPLDLPRAAREVRTLLDHIRPDLVHAMRIPVEGMLGARALENSRTPFVVSVWGNDFTLFATRYPLLARETRRAMHRADGLHPDCRRDLELAYVWGFDRNKPSLVAPGGGGVQRELFQPGTPNPRTLTALALAERDLTVFNPRGIRPYIRNDTFLRAIPAVLGVYAGARFAGAAMAGDPGLVRLVRKLGLGEVVQLLPPVDRSQMADLFRACQVLVSPSTHDGTPNSLLEGMACGAFPVAGDLPSLREWIEPGRNGLLFEARDPEALSACLIRALGDGPLRAAAREANQVLIDRDASYPSVMARAEAFYHSVAGRPAAA